MTPKEYLKQIEFELMMARQFGDKEGELENKGRLEGAKAMLEINNRALKKHLAKPEIKEKRKKYMKEYQRKYREKNREKYNEYQKEYKRKKRSKDEVTK